MNKVILVDNNDKFLGLEDRTRVHEGKGILHRAFSIVVVNSKNEILIQKRSKFKRLWPKFWSNTCCSHAKQGEKLIKTAEKRLLEEFGFSCKLIFIYKFRYKVRFKNVGSENELCYVLLGKYDGDVNPDKKEIEAYKWVNKSKIDSEFKQNSDKYTPWFKKEIYELKKRKLI